MTSTASASSSNTYDPVSTATSLATAYTAGQQTLLDAQTKTATATATALATLQTALAAFDASLAKLTAGSALLSNSATSSDTSIAAASASASAPAGSYSFFVQQLASANQVAYGGLVATSAASSGSLVVSVGGAAFSVDLDAADSNGDGALAPKEIAAAINAASGNAGLVTASVVTISGLAQLVLTANQTGAASAIGLDTGGVTNPALLAALTTAANIKQVTPATDAIAWLGDQGSGSQITQASNTFTNIDGVSVTFSKAMASGAAPVVIKVATDSGGTATHLQAFIDAYNTLMAVLDKVTNAGDPASGTAAAVFANDSGVAALRNRMASTIRQGAGAVTLASYGVSASRDGVLALDSTRLASALAKNPAGLDALMGSTGTVTGAITGSGSGSGSGIAGALDHYLNLWTNSASGQLTSRQASVSKLQTALTDRQTRLDAQYNSAYARYLAQFTQLQTMQAQMAQTSSMFDALFSSTD